MSEYKIPGACTICDKGLLAKTPPKEGVRIAFALFDGSHADLTFCDKCASSLSDKEYDDIWRKVLRSWIREIKDFESVKGWFPAEFQNGILFELGRIPLKDIHHANR